MSMSASHMLAMPSSGLGVTRTNIEPSLLVYSIGFRRLRLAMEKNGRCIGVVFPHVVDQGRDKEVANRMWVGPAG